MKNNILHIIDLDAFPKFFRIISEVSEVEQRYSTEKGLHYTAINVHLSRQMATNELHNLVKEFKLLINIGYVTGSSFILVN